MFSTGEVHKAFNDWAPRYDATLREILRNLFRLGAAAGHTFDQRCITVLEFLLKG